MTPPKTEIDTSLLLIKNEEERPVFISIPTKKMLNIKLER